MATALRDLGPGGEDVGAGSAALAADALAETVLLCHREKLMRQQHVLFELARLMAEVETAVALCHKAARREGDGGDKAHLIVPSAALHASLAAGEVAHTSTELLQGSGRIDGARLAAFRETIRFDELLGTAAGALDRMDQVAAVLTGG